MSKPPRIPDSGNSLGPITAEFDSVSLLKGLLLIDDRSPAGAWVHRDGSSRRGDTRGVRALVTAPAA